MLPISDERSSDAIPFATIMIIAVNVIVFLIQMISPNLDEIIYKFAIVPTKVDFQNINTLYVFVTSMFLHGGLMHIASNMWFLHIFGDNVEGDLGFVNYLIMYFLGGIVAGLIQYLFMVGQSIPIIGASGAIAAVLGYYLVRFPHHRIKTMIPFGGGFVRIVDMSSFFVVGMWFLTQVFSGVASISVQTADTGGVAWWAHVGGFVFGASYGFVFSKLKSR